MVTQEQVQEAKINSTEGCCSKSPRMGREQDRKWTDSLKFGESFHMKEAKQRAENEKVAEAT